MKIADNIIYMGSTPVATEYTCMVIPDCDSHHAVGFDTLADAAVWLFARKKAPHQWEMLLTAGVFELSFRELVLLSDVPRLKMVGAGVRGSRATEVKLFGHNRRKDAIEVSAMVLKLNTLDLRVEP